MKKNICITGLLDNYSESITLKLAGELGVFFANVFKLIQFDIVDVSSTIEICGLDYYKVLVAKKLKELSKFDDVIVYSNYYYLQYRECRDIVKNNLITVYLDFGEENFERLLKLEKMTELESKLARGTYKIKNKYFLKNSDIIIKCVDININNIVDQIKKSLIEYFKIGERKNAKRPKNRK